MTAAKTLSITLHSSNAIKNINMTVHSAVIAGWTGRDTAKMEDHIAELEKLGVKRPAATPLFYRVAAARLTMANTIEASGNQSSGEVEFVLFQTDDGLYVGAGSDHTDRDAETYGVTISKQMCDKPLADTAWPYAEVADHWDALLLRSWTVINGDRCLYQDGGVIGMRAPDDLIARYRKAGGTLTPGTIMFGGTLPAIGGIASAPRFEFELEDPVLNRRISHGYDIMSLPIAG